MRVNLYTSQVHPNMHVASFEIPPFNEQPAVLVWGSRVFRYLADRLGDGGRQYDYIEAFYYGIVQEPINVGS